MDVTPKLGVEHMLLNYAKLKVTLVLRWVFLRFGLLQGEERLVSLPGPPETKPQLAQPSQLSPGFKGS